MDEDNIICSDGSHIFHVGISAKKTINQLDTGHKGSTKFLAFIQKDRFAAYSDSAELKIWNYPNLVALFTMQVENCVMNSLPYVFSFSTTTNENMILIHTQFSKKFGVWRF